MGWLRWMIWRRSFEVAFDRERVAQIADKMTSDFPTAPSAYGLNRPSAAVTVEKSIHASHTEIRTPQN